MRDFKIYFGIACSLLLIYLIAQYNKPNPVNWAPSLYYNDKIPFGTYILYNQLNHLYPGTKVIKTSRSIYHTFNDTSMAAGNYVIVAKNIVLTKNDFSEMVKFIGAGNSVFMSAFTFSGFIADTLKLDPYYESKKNPATLNFTNPQLTRAKDYQFKKELSNIYFNGFDTTKALVLAKNNYNHSTLLKFNFGKGHLYLCANPLLFSNYSLLSSDGAEFAAKALSYLPDTRNTYWDEYQNGDIPADESPLLVFFSKPSLQWAYYLSLFGLLIFVLFEMKRRQRIIPVIEPLANSTLEFVTVVGQVYYEKRDNANIAHKIVLYFLTQLREQYHIKTNKFDKAFAETLVSRLGLSSIFTNELVAYLQFITSQTTVTDHELIELNKLIEQFYIKAR